MNEILLHDTEIVEADLYLQTHSTNPFLSPSTITSSIQAFLQNTPTFDSLFSVTRVQKRLYSQLALPLNHNPSILLRTQDLPPVYEENSCIYIFNSDHLKEGRNRIGKRPYMFETPSEESFDIDTEVEWQLATKIAEEFYADMHGFDDPDPDRNSKVLGVKKVEGHGYSINKNTVLVTAPYMMPHVKRFVPVLESFGLNVIVADVEERLEENDLLQYASKFDAVICGDDRFTENVYAACQGRLKVVSKWGTGVDSLKPQMAEKYGVKVTRTPGAFTKPVSDSVLGYILAFARQQPKMDRAMKNNDWTKIYGSTIGEKTVGVIGVGQIGQAVMKKLVPFGCKLLGYDIAPVDTAFLKSVKANMVTLDELLRTSDFITIHCELNEQSHHIINTNNIEIIKKGCILINTARGPCVQEEAAVLGLRRGILGGAAFDVFENEPLPKSSLLAEFDNVMLAPHNSNQSPVAHENVHWNSIRNVLMELKIPWEDTTQQIDFDSYSSLGTKFETSLKELGKSPKVSDAGSKKYAIVTGALGGEARRCEEQRSGVGIGSETVLCLQDKGYTVIGLDRRDPNSVKNVRNVSDHFFNVNIAKFVQRQQCPDTIKTLESVKSLISGSLTLLVNNAAHQVVKPCENITSDDWRETMDTNVHAPFALTQFFLPELKTSKGNVVNIASIHANLTKPGFVAYASSKGALVSLTKSMAIDLGPSGVRVNAILPAAVSTPMLMDGFKDNPSGYDKLASFHPIGRIGTPREIGEFVCFLSNSINAGFVTGSALAIDGGIGGRLQDPV
ncbi:hypothetical protein TL16_g06659 [Triparma laevis f. inornata]|uniref:Uncharacterized protein n=1 Tax=Triparma laevis f. inornata TaxID=1714386 RepID=A0A9W7EEJ6_9STRA|nr:hypothetical protein TL16_g06659 [Triparma laevis f. inornata]